MISIDVMGGDHAPEAIVQGALAAAKKLVPLKLFGPKEEILALLTNYDKNWQQYPIEVIDAPDVIAMDEEPVQAIRKKSNSSLVKATQSVARGESAVVISAGNSGALMAAATFMIGREEGVLRPAIAGFAPSLKDDVLLLDLGANTECRAEHLVQFAQLGHDYLLKTTTRKQPRIGLLSNGHEEGKGSALTKAAFSLLKASRLNFIGNVEPQDIFTGTVDIVVCDGFVGNVLLKTMESVFSMVMGLAEAQDLASALNQRLSFKKAGGALLLGVKKPVLVCHGNSGPKTIENAILFVSKLA